MTMDSGPYRIEMAGLTGLAKLSGRFSGRPQKSALKCFRSGFVWLPAVLAGFGAWTLLSGHSGHPAEGLATAAASEPAPSPAKDAPPDAFSFNPATTPLEAIALVEAAPVDGLRISSQSWRRGGLGSNALVTFTLRNGNDYAVKDIEIACAFSRRDGSHLTDRTRTIHDTVNTKSRKTFARLHVGFVNVNADKAKCSLVAASHI
jgi:hypothetical protein